MPMQLKETELLLEECGIKPTANRILVCRTLEEAGRPLSLTELEDSISSIDKSGIFRVLKLFSHNHFVHVIEDGSGGTRYELCHSADHSHIHDDEDLHPHFYCLNCRQTFCLHDTPLPYVNLPEGFSQSSRNYVIKGLCPKCTKKLK